MVIVMRGLQSVLINHCWWIIAMFTATGFLLMASPMKVISKEPNPPIWPGNVFLFRPEDNPKDILQKIKVTEDEMYEYRDIDRNNEMRWGYNSNRHFTKERYALLFAPGEYVGLDFEVGYYVHLAGLGVRADDVVFTSKRGPFVEALNKQKIVGGRPGSSLDTFWRMAENFKTNAQDGFLWAVSQAAPLRRVHVATNLILHDAGAYASGGVLANSLVEGSVQFGSQQQYLSRNINFQKGKNSILLGAWSNVFVGCENAPNPSDGFHGGPSVTIDASPNMVIEKPFIALKEEDTTKFELHIPKPRLKKNKDDVDSTTIGPDLNGENNERRDFANVKVAISNDAANVQTALDEGKDLLLSPGIYFLKKSLMVRTSNQVILGIGLATLVSPEDGSPCIKVAPHLEGVHIAGIMLEASEIVAKAQNDSEVKCLLEWGQEDTINDPGNSLNPGTLHDIFVRVGGLTSNRKVSTDIMVRLHSGNIYGDNLWLWRADHLQLKEGEEANFPQISKHYYQTVEGDCQCKIGLEVTSDDVIIHGLSVEHTTEHQLVWKGNRGNVQFYQSEFPYDANRQFAAQGFRGYYVHDKVGSHTAGGVGIYSNFRDHYVPVHTAIEHRPNNKKIVFADVFTKLLDNNGQINSVINGLGDPAKDQKDPPSRVK